MANITHDDNKKPNKKGSRKVGKKKRQVIAVQSDIEQLSNPQEELIQQRFEDEITLAKIFENSRMDIDNLSSRGSFASIGSESGDHGTEKRKPYKITYQGKSLLKTLLRFKAIKAIQIALGIYVTVLTFANIGPPGGLQDPETQLIIDQASEERTANGLILINGTKRAIVGATMFQVYCIGVARVSAWLMYPALVMVFISKFRATTSFLARSPFSMFLYGDMHLLHVYCGWTILIMSLIHTTFHLARWADQGNLHLVFHHFSGITGFIIITSMVLICIPMIVCREKIRYEVRKNLHYFFILFALALVFHTPTSAIPNGGFSGWVFSTLLVWWFLDATYCFFCMTEKIETTKFHVLPTGVQMTMKVSDTFKRNGAQGGYCYVCFPWIDKHEWHAFSLFENPANPSERQIFVQKAGDWTNKVHRVLQRDTVRPVFVQGPFPSPYDSADAYDNQILVASGIGITPALSVIRAHKDSRRINLIWAVRDRHLLNFFIKFLYLDHQGWNLIFYTGKEQLLDEHIDLFTNTNVCIIQGRPKLSELIPNIIYGIESGKGLPERYMPEEKMELSKKVLTVLEDHSIDDSTDDDSLTSQKLEDMAMVAAEGGFDLQTENSLKHVIASRGFKRKSSLDTPSQHVKRQSRQISEHLTIGFRPWDTHEEAHEYVKGLDQNLVISTWGMLFCGGARKIEKSLKKVSEEYQIDVHIESFGW